MTMPELALRFILEQPLVSTIIPGMRKVRHVEANIASSDGRRLPAPLISDAPRAPLGPVADQVVAMTAAASARPHGRRS